MPPYAEAETRGLIDLVVAVAPRGGADESFLRQFYRNVPPGELTARAPKALYATALSMWRFMAERRPGRAKLRVLNPHDTGHDWCQGRTVVEIVNDDMPFLVDSVTAALNDLDLVVHLVIHPILPIERDTAGHLIRLAEEGSGIPRESVMHVELIGHVTATRRRKIAETLEGVLTDVRSAVIDWEAMRKRVERIADSLADAALPVPASEAAEAAAFVNWLIDDNFTFLGYREYVFGQNEVTIVPDVGRGLLRDDDFLVFEGLRNFSLLSPEVQQFLHSPQLMMISKSNRRATVHRPVQMDTIGIKTFDADGVVTGQKLLLGLFTSASYSRSPRSIPLLRRKVARCMERSGFAPNSHDGKALQHILDTYPRDELFQITEDELLATGLGILHLAQHQRIALFLRRDPFERFISCLVYVPRDRYSDAVRARLGRILEQAFNGAIASASTHLDDMALARVHFLVTTTPGQVPDIHPVAVERQLAEAGRVWADDLAHALTEAHGEEDGHEKLHRFADAFPTLYPERFSAKAAVADIARIERIEAGAPIALTLYRAADTEPTALSLKVLHGGEPIALSEILPILENLGLRVITEIPYEIRPRDAAAPIWAQEFELQARAGTIDLGTTGPRFEEALPAIWSGLVENDGFNRLILPTGLSARQIVVLRTYCKVMRQAGSTFSQAYMEDTAGAHPAIAGQLVRLFETQFDPAAPEAKRTAEADRIAGQIETALDKVVNLDEDRILRGFLLLIRQTLRTNYDQRDAEGQPKPYLSVKLASQQIDLLPAPRPLVEIYVYSPRMEGCHLRGGRVARGGIRWSDRKEDFRTEILGLMKAQMVKNSVIVPVGSKGGFVVKNPPAGGRDVLMAEVVACYRTLMSGLLDLTDTIQGDAVVPPADTVRRDGDDPYLVVAADKGTATFSDIANGVAMDYGFWLGDAFASGGSVGYDHKAMGITARGAWEAVKRHFRELDIDIQATDFTCVGVGDMAGDVFGNGMLLSRHTRLLAAFNHQHIFIDPDPDPERSWQERKRLFDLPRSTWADYDAKALSKGGAIYERTAKSVLLSPEARAALGIAPMTLTPAQLIQALLQLPVDLLWFGGIGTYVKASTESQAEAGDRANDALRVDGRRIRAKVVGEGANLAMTQRGRIEYALAGGRLNTDAIDNSAGVDTSDHEVNIKIAIGNMIQSGKIAPSDRARFLASMTDEVAELVLEDNYLQTAALSLAEAEAPQLLDQHARLIRALERAGRLDRAIEFLPDDEALAQRAAARRGLTRPELAVLLAYAKNTVYAELVESDLPDDQELRAELLEYFPRRMVKLSPRDLEAHRLHREIIATHIANGMINRMGPSFVAEMQARAGRPAADIARAYRIVRDVFDLGALWRAVEAQDTLVPAQVQTQLLREIKAVAERATQWLLQSGLTLDIKARAKEFGAGVKKLAAALPGALPAGERQTFETRQAPLLQGGVPAALATRIVGLANLATALDIVRLDETTDIDIVEMARLYYDTGERLGFDLLRDRARSIPVATSWQRMAVAALLDDFYAQQSEIVRRVLGGKESGNRLDAWLSQRSDAIARIEETVAEIGRASTADLAMLTVAGRQLRGLAQYEPQTDFVR